MSTRFFLLISAFLILGVGGFFLAVVLTPHPESPFDLLPTNSVSTLKRDASSLSLSISDEPELLEAELRDTDTDIFEYDIADLEREIDAQ